MPDAQSPRAARRQVQRYAKCELQSVVIAIYPSFERNTFISPKMEVGPAFLASPFAIIELVVVVMLVSAPRAFRVVGPVRIEVVSVCHFS